MTKLARCCLIAVLAAWAALVAGGLEAETRTLTRRVAAEDLATVAVTAGAGSITVTTTEPETAQGISIEVELEPRRGGIFSSLRRAQRQVDSAELVAEVSGSRLSLEIEADSDDHRFEETWTIRLPARLAMSLELGVGDAEVRGLAGGLSLEVGYGDVLVEVEAGTGDLELALGVGDVAVTAPSAAFGEVLCSSGVGEAHLKVDGSIVDSDGLIGHTATWSGEGPAELNVEVGVGDVTVTLD
jgi:hypothetical protein